MKSKEIQEVGTPLVSIIMNCYNCDRFLKKSIDSIYAQTFSDWEIIFWDNASTDSSAIIAKSYDERLRYFKAPETTPLGTARNLAMQKTKGKYIAFLDCDDLYLPEKLERQVRIMEESDYAMCYGSSIAIDEKGDEIRRYLVRNTSGGVFASLLKRYEINMQSVMIRHEVLIKDNLQFESGMKYCPDHNLFMEIASRYPVGVIDDFVVKYRIVADSLSNKTVDIASSEIKFTLDRIFNRDPSLKEKYPNEVDQAYAKLHYYDAVAAIYHHDHSTARAMLRNVIFRRWEYFVLYLVLWVPISDRLILRMLGR